jgi:hypothetical protein
MLKPETVTIVVHPSGAGADTLTVSDAMQQVLDIFDLLARAEAQRLGAQQVVWRLESASTSSPFTVSAVAVANDPLGVVDHEAHAAKIALEEGWAGILNAREKAAWIDRDAEPIFRRILERSLNGIGRTDIRFGDDTPPVVIDHQAALRADNYLKRIAAEAAALIEDLTRTEFGSIEGDVIGITTHYRRPAFLIRDRLSDREVKCVLSDEAAPKIGAEHEWREAWSGQRVLVAGRLHFNSNGDLLKVDADEVTTITPRDVSLKDIQGGTPDPGAPSARKYLDKLWGEPDA